MRQFRSYGSVRGVRGNSHPYRDIAFYRLPFSARRVVTRGRPRSGFQIQAIPERPLVRAAVAVDR